jgi:hypothetical protein
VASGHSELTTEYFVQESLVACGVGSELGAARDENCKNAAWSAISEHENAKGTHGGIRKLHNSAQ